MFGVSVYAQEGISLDTAPESTPTIHFTNKLLVVKDLQFTDGRMLAT